MRANSLGAVHDGHVDVEQDEIEGLLSQTLQRLLTVGRLGDDGALRLEEEAHDLAVDCVVVGEQNACAAQADDAPWRLGGRGTGLPTPRSRCRRGR